MTDDTARHVQLTERQQRVERAIALPVLIAALASVPAVFLTLFDGRVAQTGSILNGVSGAVLIAEAVVLFAVAPDKRRWLSDNRWLVALSVAVLLAVIFAIGPVQLLRLVRVFGALRIIRVKRIFKAGAIVQERYAADQHWQRATTVLVTVLCAAFVAIVLADPTSQSRIWAETAYGWLGPVRAVLAGVIIAGATFIVAQRR
jgi:CsoR family transcriptional regulator, copper-sensing transcriptional repressor